MAKLLFGVCLALLVAVATVSAGYPCVDPGYRARSFKDIKGWSPKKPFLGFFTGNEVEKGSPETNIALLADGDRASFFYSPYGKTSANLATDEGLNGETFYKISIKCTGPNEGYFLLSPLNPSGVPEPSKLFYCQSFKQDPWGRRIVSPYTSDYNCDVPCPPISSSAVLGDYPKYVQGLDLFFGRNTDKYVQC